MSIFENSLLPVNKIENHFYFINCCLNCIKFMEEAWNFTPTQTAFITFSAQVPADNYLLNDTASLSIKSMNH